MSEDSDPDTGDTSDDDPDPDAYADLGATTEAAMEVAETSLDRVRELVPGDDLADRLRRKAVHATGDPEFQQLMRFGGDPVVAGARAVRDGAQIVTDVTMPRQGITDRGHDCEKHTAVGTGDALAQRTGMTRTAAGVLELDRRGVYDDAIAVIGNAPTAALALADCIEDGTRPAVVVATPVGFVKAAESRERLREVGAEYGVPTVTNVGRRGGSGLAAALANELIHVARDARDGEVSLE